MLLAALMLVLLVMLVLVLAVLVFLLELLAVLVSTCYVVVALTVGQPWFPSSLLN